MKSLKCWFAGHRYQFRNNVYGDRIIFLNARSIWDCVHCGKVEYRKELYEGNATKSTPATTEKEKS